MPKAIAFSYQAEWYQRNLQHNRDVRREYSRKFRETQPEKKLYNAAKDRAKKSSLEFNIEISDIIIPSICPILGQPLVRNTRYAPSLDRINPSLGYIKNNVWVISKKANVMKNDANREELEEFARWIKRSTI